MSNCTVCSAPVPGKRKTCGNAPCRRARKAVTDAVKEERNRSKRNEQKRQWRQTTAGQAALRKAEGERRARMADAPSDGHTKQELWESYEERGLEGCSLNTHPECTGTYDEDEHIIPLCRGGGHTVGNLRPVCMTCNRGVGGKHSKTPAEVEGFQGVWPTKEQRHGYETQSSAAA